MEHCCICCTRGMFHWQESILRGSAIWYLKIFATICKIQEGKRIELFETWHCQVDSCYKWIVGYLIFVNCVAVIKNHTEFTEGPIYP